MSDQQMKAEIYKVLSKDEDIITNLLLTLESERQMKKDLIIDMNLQLSKAQIYINNVKETKHDQSLSFNKSFIMGEISDFYERYRGKISACFTLKKN